MRAAHPTSQAGRVARGLRLAVILLGAFFAASSGFAANCAITHDPAPSDADKALLTADYAKAESLYKAALAASPGNAQLTIGLVHALLRDQKVQEAADTVAEALTAVPNSPVLIILRGEVELRAGEPWTAANQSINRSLSIRESPVPSVVRRDSEPELAVCLGAQRTIVGASTRSVRSGYSRQLDDTLPTKQRIAEIESYLSAPSGDDAESIKHLRQYLEHLRKLAGEPRKPCKLVSQTASTQMPIVPLMRDATHVQGLGLDLEAQ